MFKIIVLICAVQMPQSECTERTARAVVHPPNDGVLCGPHSQMLVALSERLVDEYIKIICKQ